VDRILTARYREIVDDELLAASPQERFEFWVRKFGKPVEISGIVQDDDGHAVAQAERLKAHALPPSPAVATASPRFDSLTLPTLGHVRRLIVAVATPGDAYKLTLLAELEHVDEELGLVIRALLITVPTTLVVAAALAYWLAYKSLAPVEHLRRLADEITAERLDRRLPVHNPADELGLLAQTINSMIARLERSFDEVRRFTADASHELRTPIAVIRSEAEMGMEAAADLEESRHRFISILEECGRLASITSQLLTLSREDAGITPAARHAVPLKPLLLDAVESFRSLANLKRQDLVADVDCEAVVSADGDRLRQVFDNLIDNAIKYTPPDGRITVHLTGDVSSAVVAVQDNGIGIDPEHVRHVFDRFYRVGKGDGLDDLGAGLGLSIVRSIVSSLGGRVEVESTLGEGSAFRVHLPVLPRDPSQQE
jgi:signal transduction histidine kinase